MKLAAGGIVVIGILTAAISFSYRHAEQDALMRADPDMILDDPGLSKTALSIGKSVFGAHCAACHGAKGVPDQTLGVPDLGGGGRLYGQGRVSEIEWIVLHGIRGHDGKGWNLASMPIFASARPYAAEPLKPLDPGEIQDVVQYLFQLQGRPADPDAATHGKVIYTGKGGCYDCHGEDARGDPAIGAPNLTDHITLYGDGSTTALFRSIATGRAGVSPAFARHLKPFEARAVAFYVASLAAAPKEARP